MSNELDEKVVVNYKLTTTKHGEILGKKQRKRLSCGNQKHRKYSPKRSFKK